MSLRGKLFLSRPLTEMMPLLKTALTGRLSWDVLFCLNGSDDGFSSAVRKRARDYLRVFKDRAGVYDLDQLPRGRPRRARAGCSLFGLTAHTRNVVSA